MKRAWTKKIKAIPACAVSNNSMEEHFKQVQPQVKRRVRTSAAMIGLIISTGASNLILTKPSDSAPAPEPILQEPISSSDASVSLAAEGVRANLVKPEALPSVTVDVFSTVATTPKLLSAVPTPTPPLVERLKQQQQTFNQVAQEQVDTGALRQSSEKAPIAPTTNKIKQSDLKTEQTLKISRSRLIERLKASKTTAINSKSYTINPSKIASPVIAAVSKPQKLQEAASINSQVNNSALTAKQKLLVDSLRQKPNRLRERLALLRLEQGKYSLAATQKAETSKPVSSVLSVVDASKQAVEMPQEPALVVEMQPQPTAVAVVSELPKSAVSQPTVVVASVVPDYQRPHISSELTNGNYLTARNQLGTNQQILIPNIEQNSAANQSNGARQLLGVLARQEAQSNDINLNVEESQPQLAAVMVKATALPYQVRSGDTLSAIAKSHKVPLSELIKVNRLANPDQLQVNQKINVPTSHYSSVVSRTVANEQLARTPSSTVYAGIGGNISDDDSVQASLSVEETKLVRSPAQPESQSNLYVQNLQTEIQLLRQKYQTQQTITQAVPVINDTTTLVTATKTNRPLSLKPPANQPINPEFSGRVQKQRSIPAKSLLPPASRDKVATAPISEPSFRGNLVSPELPPLGAVDTYLPKAGSASFKNYIWPTKGALTSGYGWRWGRMHKGIDIAAPIGTPIVAAAPGVVVKAGWNSGGYGNLVDIQHTDGTVTRYAHNKRILVQTGQQVDQGQQISEMGNTGFSTGPHLHFEVHPLGKKAVNPIAFLPR